MPGGFAVSPSSIEFLEKVLSSHQQVDEYEQVEPGVFRIRRKGGKSNVLLLLVDFYTIGIAEMVEAVERCPKVTCVVTVGSRASWTKDAKEFGKERRIGVFNLKEFFGALWSTEPYNYVKKTK